MEMECSSGVLMELGILCMVLLRCGRSKTLAEGLETGDRAARGISGEDGDVASLALTAAGGDVITSEGLLCKPLGRERVDVDMDVERERYE